MKLALLLSGLPREWRMCLPTQLALFRGHEVDVYFHFWDTVERAEKDEILGLLKPKAWTFETPRDFSAFDNDPAIRLDRINVPSRLASQYYSWRQVAALFEPHIGDYALAMRSRSDLQFVLTVGHIFPQMKPGQLLLPWAEKGVLLSDLFALGDVQAVHYYHTLYDRFADYAREVECNAEILLAHHLKQAQGRFHYLTDDTPYCFVRRPHMANYTVQQCLAEKPGRSKWLSPEIVENHRAFHAARQGAEGEAHVEKFRAEQLKAMAEDSSGAAGRR